MALILNLIMLKALVKIVSSNLMIKFAFKMIVLNMIQLVTKEEEEG